MLGSISKMSFVVHINMMNNAWNITRVIFDGYANFAFLDLSGGPVGK
jgi:hypothetical protein